MTQLGQKEDFLWTMLTTISDYGYGELLELLCNLSSYTAAEGCQSPQ